MLTFLARRALGALAFTIVVPIAAIVLGRWSAGNLEAELSMQRASAVSIAEARAAAGLDRSAAAQIAGWVAGVARFDLGRSARFGRPVSELVLDGAAHTAALAALALLVATVIGWPLGVVTGARPRSALAALVAPLSLAFVACPPIVGALALMLLAVSTGWLSVAPGSLALPTLALALPLAATLERLQAQATSEAMSAPDLPAAAARGVPMWRLIWVHGARQSLRPVLGVFGVIVGSLFSGSLAVEVLTARPGLGHLMFDAIGARDLWLVAGCAFVGAILLAACNLAADALRALADPRVRES
jgi:peptide/nickel transport system permease protein